MQENYRSYNDWRIRIGDYRVIYEIDDRAKVVKVMRIRHRREAYRANFSSDKSKSLFIS
jgi:mRNA-degrading endonuclease RelE of RelBE toxin-antitoxin system